jgi:hypothetical protein
MRETRSEVTGGLKDEQMLEGIREVILAANNVADLQIDIIGAGCQMLRRHSDAPQQREIFDIRGQFGLIAVHFIVKRDFVGWLAPDLKANHKRFSGGRTSGALIIRQRSHLRIAKPWPGAVRLIFGLL